MAGCHKIDNTLPVPEEQSIPSVSSCNLHDAMAVEDKLLMLDRAPYLDYFQELRTQQIVTPNLRLACTWLVQDVLSADNRDSAVELIASVLWPRGSWSQSRDQLFMYLDVSLRNQAYEIPRTRNLP